MKFYHGGASEPVLEKIEGLAPSFEHGNGWTPGSDGKCFDRPDRCYFLDNGAFTSSFNEREWIQMLEKVSNFESCPDFVVLPDVFNDAQRTWKRHEKYVDIVEAFGFSHYYVVQPDPNSQSIDENIEKTIQRALELESDGLFIGGSWHKPRIAPDFIDRAGQENLNVHIGMPKDLLWAARSGADSMDTVSIARNQSWGRIKNLEDSLRSQTTLR